MKNSADEPHHGTDAARPHLCEHCGGTGVIVVVLPDRYWDEMPCPHCDAGKRKRGEQFTPPERAGRHQGGGPDQEPEKTGGS